MNADQIPFDQLSAFARWFLAQQFAALRPPMYGVYDFGDLRSLVLYRVPPFQAELLIVGPDPKVVTEHGHPDIDSYEMLISGEIQFSLQGKDICPPELVGKTAPDGSAALFANLVRVKPNEPHGAVIGRHGGAFLSLQHWLNGVEPSSVGLNWSGQPHEGEKKERYRSP
jgi:hypothetical protein